jgi:hypothetical protein
MIAIFTKSSPPSGRTLRAATLLACVTAGPACDSGGPPPRTAADQATFVERTRCMPEDDDKALAPVLSGEALQSVAPLYSRLEQSKSGFQSELRGATLTVHALPGMTPEWLDRALECHGARAMLGHGAAVPNDPFFVPNSFVDIDVTSGKDGFDIEVVAYSSADANEVLARATAFAKDKPGAAPAPPSAATPH